MQSRQTAMANMMFRRDIELAHSPKDFDLILERINNTPYFDSCDKYNLKVELQRKRSQKGI